MIVFRHCGSLDGPGAWAEEGEQAVSGEGLRFVIHKHAARRLHYDLRLESGGMLLSWACPKGPSMDPRQKRLAVRVEDHEPDYADFEGTIPEGEYGAGTVQVWDQGFWVPEGDVDAGLSAGKLLFALEGHKLNGRWALIHVSGSDSGAKQNWLLVKERDDYAREDGDILAERPESVLSGLAIEQIGRAGTGPEAGRGAHPDAADKIGIAGVSITNPDRVLFPDERITKLELATFYSSVADWILPHVSARPVALLRCPEGRTGECFFQKRATPDLPEWVVRVPVEVDGEPAEYMSVDSQQGLVFLAQLDTLEIHTWSARVDALDRPDRLVIDLDPDPSVPVADVVTAARLVRDRLGALGLISFVKTSGGKGYHVVVPLVRRAGWKEVEAFAEALALDIVRTAPDRYTASSSRPVRAGRIFVDYLRTSRAATTVAPYSPRARPGAPLSTPLGWDELKHVVRPDAYTLRNLPRRLAGLREDPWNDYNRVWQSITAAMRAELGVGA